MATIEFRGKIENIYNSDETLAYRRIKVPAIERRHCDMAAFRSHPRFGAYANSDLFKNLLAKQLREAAIGPYIRLDRVPDAATVDESGFLAKITVTL